MQHDLHNYFGYDVKVETRMMPYWKITCTPESKEKLRTKGNKDSTRDSDDDYFYGKVQVFDSPMKYVVDYLWTCYQLEPPFIDETGIDFNVNVDFGNTLGSFEKMKKTLANNGLYLIKGEKEMKVIVIRDSSAGN